MATGRPWQTLIMLHKARKDGILRRLSMLEERLRHAKELEERLDLYQQETDRSFRESVRNGPVTTSFLRGATQFYGRLDEGRAVQSAEITRLMQTIAEVRDELIACNMEIMKYEKLIEKDAAAESRRLAVAEQKATDNLVNAAVARNLLRKDSRRN